MYASWEDWFEKVAEHTKARQRRKRKQKQMTSSKKMQKRAGWLNRLKPKPWRGGMHTVSDLRKDACPTHRAARTGAQWQVGQEVQNMTHRRWKTKGSAQQEKTSGRSQGKTEKKAPLSLKKNRSGN